MSGGNCKKQQIHKKYATKAKEYWDDIISYCPKNKLHQDWKLDDCGYKETIKFQNLKNTLPECIKLQGGSQGLKLNNNRRGLNL